MALGAFLDAIPAPRRVVRDRAAVARGQRVFESSRTGCAGCHSGPSYTNALTFDVGTGGPLQVPSLLGLSDRGSYLHHGCADRLRDRFGPCGGDRHGRVGHLSPPELADLIRFLEAI
jgi:mono/diheme cytochrome c family protein